MQAVVVPDIAGREALYDGAVVLRKAGGVVQEYRSTARTKERTAQSNRSCSGTTTQVQYALAQKELQAGLQTIR